MMPTSDDDDDNIGTHWKGIETSFQVVPLFLKSFHFETSFQVVPFNYFMKFFHFWVSYITFRNFLKIPSVIKGLSTILLYGSLQFYFREQKSIMNAYPNASTRFQKQFDREPQKFHE
jgi:hypothetical protein